MTYLLIGPDIQKKDTKIAELKAKFLSDPAAVSFDYELLHAHKLDADTLKKSLMTIAHIASKRLVVVRQCEKLNEHNRDIIFEFLESPVQSTVLVLDFDELDGKGALFTRLKPMTEVSFCGSVKVLNVFDMTRAITSKNPTEALRIFYELLDNNTHPLQVMGGLVWYWGKERERLNPNNFRKGLTALEEADLNIKRSRLKPEYAIEKVIVELTMIQ